MGMRFSLHAQVPGEEYKRELLSSGVKLRDYAEAYLLPHMEPVDEYGYTRVTNLKGFHEALESRIKHFKDLMDDQHSDDWSGWYNECQYYQILRDLSTVALCLEANKVKWCISVM